MSGHQSVAPASEAEKSDPRWTMPSRVTILLSGARREEAALAAACQLRRVGNEALSVLLLRPSIPAGFLWAAGVDPERLRRETEAEQRRTIREMVRRQGEDVRCSLTLVDWRSCRTAILAEIADGVDTLLIPAGCVPRWRLHRLLRGTGSIVTVLPSALGLPS